MNLPSPTPIFPAHSLSPEELDTFSSLPVEAQCLLFLSKPPSEQSQMLEQTLEVDTILLIIGDYLLQKSPTNGEVLSVIKCEYDLQFEIIRKAAPVANRMGQIEALRFSWKGAPQRTRTLLVRPHLRTQLEKFGRILGRKYIVQLGFHSCFKANKKIGKGMTACVYNAVNLNNGKEVAIKSFKRSVYFATDNGNGKISFMKEFKILTECNHKNICQIHSVFETDNSTYVILELYPLSLYGYLQKCGFPNIEQAKVIMINLLEGIAYLHQRGVMHRDLKLQNIMVKRDNVYSGRVIPVIVDLGLAEYTSSTKYLYTRCGTPGYVAPQVLKIKSSDPLQTYTSACDIFSLGVIFHILLFKKPVFQGREVKEVIKRNGECDINFSSQLFSSIDEAGRDLLRRMLCKDSKERITAAEALLHPFLTEERKQLELQAETVFRTGVSLSV